LVCKSLGCGLRVLLIQQIDGRSPGDGRAYGFTNRNGSRLKLLIWDGTRSGYAIADCTEDVSAGLLTAKRCSI